MNEIIQLVDRALERFFRDVTPLSESAVDVSFDTPDRTWGAGLSRPTVNIFLWEINRAEHLLRAGLQQRSDQDGNVERRPATPVAELNYLATAWANEQRDEHQLLGSLLQAVLANRFLPASVLPEPLAGHRYGLTLGGRDRRPSDFWGALDGRLKPGLHLVVSVPFEVFSWRPAAPPAESINLSSAAMTSPAAAAPSSDEPVIRRRRATGSLVMEGKPSPGEDAK